MKCGMVSMLPFSREPWPPQAAGRNRRACDCPRMEFCVRNRGYEPNHINSMTIPTERMETWRIRRILRKRLRKQSEARRRSRCRSTTRRHARNSRGRRSIYEADQAEVRRGARPAAEVSARGHQRSTSPNLDGTQFAALRDRSLSSTRSSRASRSTIPSRCLFIGGGFSALLTSARLREVGVESIRIVERGGGRRRHLVLEPLSWRRLRRRRL